jgi:hypothetical protein
MCPSPCWAPTDPALHQFRRYAIATHLEPRRQHPCATPRPAGGGGEDAAGVGKEARGAGELAGGDGGAAQRHQVPCARSGSISASVAKRLYQLTAPVSVYSAMDLQRTSIPLQRRRLHL